MTTLWKTYADDHAARRTVTGLIAAGVPARDVMILTGTGRHDVRNEPVGEYGCQAAPDDPVGTFGNVHLLRRQGRGAFAGDPDRQRQGSFADTDRDMIITYERGGEHCRVAGDEAVRELLRDAELGDQDVNRILADLAAGYPVIVAEIADIAPADVRARLDLGGGRAA
jgi:hypothetical protein